MNLLVNKPNTVIENNVDTRWSDATIYNHYDNPLDFMDDILENSQLAECSSNARRYLEQGKKAYTLIDRKDTTYDKKYEAIALEVKNKLIARGFTTKMLYADVEFTCQNTGVMSKQRAMMGRRDCYYKNTAMTDGKLFHDIYINMSYSGSISDEVIEKKSYALYALVKELSRLIPMRVFVVNHVGHSTTSAHTNERVEGTCYSYVLKKFGLAVNPKEFLFFTSDSKRTFGWASYDMACGRAINDAHIGDPTNTVSIASLNLDKEIDTIWTKFQQHYGY